MVDFAARRTIMVDTQVRPSDVTRYPIIDAMLRVPRELYVPDAARATAYAEQNIPLDEGRVVLAPRTFAKMLEAANIGNADVVLDLGCGLGYSTAVLAQMAQAVVAVEPDETRAQEAQQILSGEGVDNAAVMARPLAEGAPQADPYDAIVVEGAVETWPEALSDQLREGGRAVALFSEGRLCTARIGWKENGRMIWRDLFAAGAPVLEGFARKMEFAL